MLRTFSSQLGRSVAFISSFHNQMSTEAIRSTAASGASVYESARATHEYLQFHFGDSLDLFPYQEGEKELYEILQQSTLQFNSNITKQLADLTEEKNQTTALDIGCAVGGASFQLAKHFDQVLGIDFSSSFVDAANEMKSNGQMEYTCYVHGDVSENKFAKVESGIDRSKVSFQQGDACNLNRDIGTFDAILASNLLCRLPDPLKFLSDLHHFVTPGGVVALISPYSWLEEYTPKEKWIGAYYADGDKSKPVDSFEVVEKILTANNFELVKRKNYSFLIREHARKFQLGVSDGTFWRKKLA